MYTGEKVRLRAYRQSDLPLIHEYVNDEDIVRMFWPGVPFPHTLPEDEKSFAEISSKGNSYYFAIEAVETGDFIGGCGTEEVDWKNSTATVGIYIGNKDYWGRGYGSEAMKLLVNFIFRQMNINKAKLYVFAFNSRAIASYKKCGFVVEGTLRQEIFRDGRYHDKIAMGLLREEYLQSLS